MDRALLFAAGAGTLAAEKSELDFRRRTELLRYVFDSHFALRFGRLVSNLHHATRHFLIADQNRVARSQIVGPLDLLFEICRP